MNRTLLLSEHGPTHIDAINHLEPTSDLSIDDMSLERFYGDAICLDVSETTHPDSITVETLQGALSAHDLDVRNGDVVLVDTGNRRSNYSTTDKEKKRRYRNEFVGFEEAAAEFLVERGARALGIDSISVDHPTNIYPNYDFPVHALASREELVIYENMANLHEVVGHRFTLCAFPLKIRDGTGSPVRPVAILETQ